MPLVLEGRSTEEATALGRPLTVAIAAPAASCVLDIGLVNNMPDAALRATEAQFARLLAAAAGRLTVRLHFFGFPEIPRGPAVQTHLRRGYRTTGELAQVRLDALIVTGAEPKAASLTEEPYWDSFRRLVDWAERHTISTFWSCLAAHAAVLHLDGVVRHRLPQKRFGLFECLKVVDHPMLAGTPSVLRVPHSRWNDVREGDLRAHNYRILTRSHEAGIDLFMKEGRSTFVFAQGHPEYEPETLLREYKRDAQRFLRRERDDFPVAPLHFLAAKSEEAARAFEARARDAREAGTLSELRLDWALREPFVEVWRQSAVRICRNWLQHLAAKR